jgi:hypothetical protein
MAGSGTVAFHFDTETLTVPVQVRGLLRRPGFSLQPRTTGFVTLTNTAGSIDLQLQGPEQKVLAGLPSTLAFTFQQAIGRYATRTGHGCLELRLTTTQPHREFFAEPSHDTVQEAGAFWMTLRESCS